MFFFKNRIAFKKTAATLVKNGITWAIMAFRVGASFESWKVGQSPWQWDEKGHKTGCNSHVYHFGEFGKLWLEHGPGSKMPETATNRVKFSILAAIFATDNQPSKWTCSEICIDFRFKMISRSILINTGYFWYRLWTPGKRFCATLYRLKRNLCIASTWSYRRIVFRCS